MAKPPPPPPSDAAKSAVEAFGSALDLAVSRVDMALDDVGSGEANAPAKQNIPIFGEHTPEPAGLPPSLDHLQLGDQKLELGAPVPMPPVQAAAPSGGSSLGPWLVLLFAAAALGAAAYFFLG